MTLPDMQPSGVYGLHGNTKYHVPFFFITHLATQLSRAMWFMCTMINILIIG